MSGSYVGKTVAVILTTAFIVQHSHAQSGDYTVTERGADYKVLQKMTVENGTNRIHRYTELATGLNYTNASGQWTEAREQISLLPTGGAAATQGRHKVYFPSDIYNGVLEVVTPDGKHLRSRPLGVSYDDGSNTVFIATLKHAQGYLTSSNQVTYRDAFTDFKADLVCTYRRSGFECDLVFRAQPPTPEQYGLNPDSSTLQMITEFFNTQDPEQIPATSDEWYGLQDSTLKFGKLTMKQGKAFAIKTTNSQPSTIHAQRDSAPVYKRWLKLEGRKFLIEELPLEDLAEDLSALPLTASDNPKTPDPKSKTLFASHKRQFPPAHEFTADTNQILLAAADFTKEPGVVLDYTTIDSDQSDFTFQSGVTYLVTSPVFFGGGSWEHSSVVFQGGAVIKFTTNASSGITLNSSSDAEFQTTPENPVVLTSQDDDTVGVVIPGSTGNPVILTNVTFLGNIENNPGPNNLHFRYAGIAVSAWDPVTFQNCRFTDCYKVVCLPSGEVDFYNCLFSRCTVVISYSQAGGEYDAENQWVKYDGIFYYVIIQNVTADQMGGFMEWPAGGWADSQVAMDVANCIFTRFDDSYYTLYWDLLFYAEGGRNVEQPLSLPYESAGSANFYLASNSPYHNVGTTNIDAGLLAKLQTLTTYAPQDGGYPDTNAPDLGYHYPVNEDSDHDGLPDWWEWHLFGGYTYSGTDLDANGNTFLSDYQEGLSPLRQAFGIFIATPGNAILQP